MTPAARRRDADCTRFQHYMRNRDVRLRDELIGDYLPLADSCARRYRRRGEPDEDLEQVARIGLLKAVDRFDPARGTSFSSYAVPTIVGELQRHFRDHGWTVRPPRGLQEDVLRMERQRAALVSQLGREPSAAQLAVAVGTSVEEILEAREAARARGGTSLDAPVGEPGGATVGDLVGDEDAGFGRIDAALIADSLIATLSERDQMIVRLRFEQELTQSEIGRRVGCSQMQVSRLLRAALVRLRAEAYAAGLVAC